MKLLVLAGGFGSRLKSVVSDVPKALAPVCNVPFLRIQIQNWQSQGFYAFTFLLYYKANIIIEFLEKEKETGLLKNCEVDYLVEPSPLGTGGAIAFAVEQLGLSGDFLVTNSDTWLSTSLEVVARATSPAMAVVEFSDAARYGHVQFDDKNRVTSFQEKHIIGRGTCWINAGLFKLNAEAFKGWDHSPYSLEQVTFPAMVDLMELNAVSLHTDFIDIGVPNDYFLFCRWIESGRKGALWG